MSYLINTTTSLPCSAMQVTVEQIRDIISSSDGNQTAPEIAAFSEIKHTGYSYTASWKSYHIILSGCDKSYLLLVSPRTPTVISRPGPITFSALSTLLTKILDTSTVPVPRPVARDVQGPRWHFDWLLLRVPDSESTHPPTSLASIRSKLSLPQLARVETKLGTHLRALHEITNDLFGVPTDKLTPPPSVPSLATLLSTNADGCEEDMTPYSWQDSFVLQLEELLERVCGEPSGHSVDFDVNELRRSLSRAIGSFLFDDVETPRLVWVTGNEEDVIVSLTSEKDRKLCGGGTVTPDAEVEIAYMLPTFGYALWGDPLMEALFLPPGPNSAINEGYFDGGEEENLIVFPRHKTKRVWYTVYLALIVLAQGEEERETTTWARNTLPECVKDLRDVPYY